MESIEEEIKKRTTNIVGGVNKTRSNVNVDKDLINNVYDDNVRQKIQEAIDKPKAIGTILAEKLNAPSNLKLYIKLAYQCSTETLFECLALTEEAYREERIRTTKAQYFYGIIRKKKKNE